MIMHDNADPAAYLRALLDPSERDFVDRVEKAKTAYMTSERDEDLARLLKRLTTNAVIRRDPTKPHAANNRAPGKGVVIVGPSGAGKSRLLDETFRDNAAFPNFGIKGTWCPLISVTAPSPCTLGQVGIRLLDLMDYDLRREIRENNAWLRVRQQLRENNILFLAFDDLQHVLHGYSEDEVQKVRDTLKDLMTNPEWPVQLILSGIPELLPFFRHDRQLRRRLRFMYLAKLTPKQHAEFLEQALDHYASEVKLKLAIKPEDDLVARLLHAGQYEMGITLEILAEAMEEALDHDANRVTMTDFANAYASRNLMPDDQNPFVSNAWHTIDTTRLQTKDEEEIDDATTPVGKKRKGKKS
ncbi:ATP-binding protein [Bradyrhizobium sp. AS23.2]|uniref:ATP-binding protein n=1 Tax=Bradyrhizobium sp. AS23.2 TaxID=1680155 RepID=UPI000ADFB510|nr:ATP-binding protein [Bradyrhizobium sp. AS23.2]